MEHDIVIVGGGLSGLISSIALAQKGYDVAVVEKKEYPFHRVCGEYISKEVVPYLQSLNAYPTSLEPSDINEFQLTSVSGQSAIMPLDLGGFGISRYNLDLFLYERAKAECVTFYLKTQAQDFQYQENHFELALSNGTQLIASVLLGAHGKRSKIDKALNRKFISDRSDYIGVKYHVKMEFPENRIALHNFEGGYCGMSKVEGDRYNLCYLGNRKHLRQYGNIEAMEKAILHKNPFLATIFREGDFLFDKPEVINEINFRPKTPVDQHMLMVGDAAGLITPLCGNGMALAIHSAKVATEAIDRHYPPRGICQREALEIEYSQRWNRLFARRLWVGRKIQGLFGGIAASNLAVKIARRTPWIARRLMEKTHGKPF